MMVSQSRGGTARLGEWLCLIGVGSSLGYAAFALAIGGWPVPNPFPPMRVEYRLAFCLLFLVLFGLLLLASWLVFRSARDDLRILAGILGFAALFRLLLLPTPPALSGDIYRYVWDARVQAAGGNPYLTAPADLGPEAMQRDALLQKQNRPLARTIYPPLAQLAFHGVRLLAGESVIAMKGLMILGDLATLGILVRLLGALGLPRSRAILYAWNPLAVFEIAGSGHVDALALPCILLAVLAWHRGQNVLAGIAGGAATLVKIYPILLLPVLFARGRWPVLLGWIAILVPGYLPYLPESGLQVLGHLPRFLADPYEVFNPSIMGLVLLMASRVGGAPVALAAWIGRAGLLFTLVWVLRDPAEDTHRLLDRVFIVGTAATLLTLTLHPWYLLWLVCLLPVQPRPAWIYLSGAVVTSYAFYVVTPPARILIGVLEYLPFLALLVWQWRRAAAPLASAGALELAQERP